MADVTNPGSTNVANQSYDGLPYQQPPISTSPSTTSVRNVIVVGSGDERKLVSIDQCVTVTPATTSTRNVFV